LDQIGIINKATKMSHLLVQYRKNVSPALQKEFGLKNIMAGPKIEKVVINVGVGRLAVDNNALERVKRDLALLSGQKPVIIKAKKSIASFKLRQGMSNGAMVTLRGKRMYDFLDRLNNIALPRSKDFHGIDLKNIDSGGNLNLGIKEHSIFPEIHYENLKDIFSLQVTVVTKAENREQAIGLFRKIGFPLKRT
jgi:large subunit ribosomal protein L5